MLLTQLGKPGEQPPCTEDTLPAESCSHHVRSPCIKRVHIPMQKERLKAVLWGWQGMLKKCLRTLQLAGREVGSQSHVVFSNRNGALLVSAGALLAAPFLGSGICACSFQHGYHTAKLKGAFPAHCHSWASPTQAAQDVCAGERSCSCCISVIFT